MSSATPDRMPPHDLVERPGVPCRAVAVAGYVHVLPDGRLHCNRCGWTCDPPATAPTAEAQAALAATSTKDLLWKGYALTHVLHGLPDGAMKNDRRAARDLIDAEVCRRTAAHGEAVSVDLFLSPDGDDEPTIWQPDPEHPSAPTALVRRCEVAETIWNVLTAAVGE